MKSKTQINIGIATSIFSIILFSSIVFIVLNKKLDFERYTFAMNAQLEAERQKIQRENEEAEKKYKESLKNSKEIMAQPMPITPQTVTTNEKIDEKFKQEAIEKVSYFSVVFKKSNIMGIIIVALIFVIHIAYVYTAYRRYLWPNFISFILIFLFYGLWARSIGYFEGLRGAPLRNVIATLIFMLLLILLLAQSIFGILNTHKKQEDLELKL
ncbi:MAG: hypothetical protein ABSF37_02605 [Sedimentisphaerales bacterium]|jgi:hypothetical protein